LIQKLTAASTESDSDSTDNSATLATIVGKNIPAFPWQNSSDRLDANTDSSVSPIDALVIINELNDPMVSGAGGLLPAPPAAGITFYYDVSGDGVVSPIDVLLVINFLNDLTGGESETPANSPLFQPDAPSLAAISSRSALSAASSRLPPIATVAGPTPAPPTIASDEQARDDSHRDTSLGQHTTEYRDLADALFALVEDWND
jgi:hypothetical protein